MPKTKKVAGGWKPKKRTRRIEPRPDVFPHLEAEDGDEGLWADIRANLTMEQLEGIPDITDKTTKWRECFDAIAAYVVDWNVMAEVAGSEDEYAPVPPPAVGGPKVFEAIPHAVSYWLAWELKVGWAIPDANLKKESTTSKATADTSSASA